MAEILNREPSDYVYPEDSLPTSHSVGGTEHVRSVGVAANASSIDTRQTAEVSVVAAPPVHAVAATIPVVETTVHTAVVIAPCAAVSQDIASDSESHIVPVLTATDGNKSSSSLSHSDIDISLEPVLSTLPNISAVTEVPITAVETQEIPSEACRTKDSVQDNAMQVAGDADPNQKQQLHEPGPNIVEYPPAVPSSSPIVSLVAVASKPSEPTPANTTVSPRREGDGIRQIGMRTFLV
jgi:hypothetical protein